jgi:hypothetical protein
MLMSEAVKMVKECPTDDAIADLLVTFGVVAMPTLASQCGLAEFFNRCDDVHSSDVQSSDELNVAEVVYRTEAYGKYTTIDLTKAALEFINKFDMCYYPKLVPQDIAEVYEMFNVRWGQSNYEPYITIRGSGDYFGLTVIYRGRMEERYEATRTKDGSFDFTLINTEYI